MSVMPYFQETAIFKSAPNQMIYDNKIVKIAVEKARFADIEKMLKYCPIAVSLNIYGDRDLGRGYTPLGNYNRDFGGKDFQLQYIKRMGAQLSINIHVARSDKSDYDRLLHSAIQVYLAWTMDTLHDYVNVTGEESSISDLSYLDRGLVRKQFEVPIQYDFALIKRTPSIEWAEANITVDDYPLMEFTLHYNTDGEGEP